MLHRTAVLGHLDLPALWSEDAHRGDMACKAVDTAVRCVVIGSGYKAGLAAVGHYRLRQVAYLAVLISVAAPGSANPLVGPSHAVPRTLPFLKIGGMTFPALFVRLESELGGVQVGKSGLGLGRFPGLRAPEYVDGECGEENRKHHGGSSHELIQVNLQQSVAPL
jgi:hypothetical protein